MHPSFLLLPLEIAFLLVALFLCLTKASRLSPEQYNALQLLYDATDGPNWIYIYSGQKWDFSDTSSDPCEDHWSGVACLNDPAASLNTVINLQLGGYNLAGKIPEDFAVNMSSLKSLYLNDNQLTGTIPGELGKLYGLRRLYVYSNKLTGVLPVSLQDCGLLETIDVSNNLLRGNLGNYDFLRMKALREVFMSSNTFSGPVPSNFSDIIGTIDLSNNAFTGRIPEILFEFPLLEIFAASVNCLSLEVPLSLCNSTSIQTLLISGLHQGSKCDRNDIDTSMVSLPSCLWSISSLNKLYLSGNGYLGEMQDVYLPNLTELSVGYNRLYGAIPSFFNNKSMEVFDISNNMLKGRLYDAVIHPNSSASTFHAGVNRLSGPLNLDAIDQFKSTVSILNGNMFSCSSARKLDQDSDQSNYICGSEGLESSLYYWCAFLVIFLALTIMCIMYGKPKSTIASCGSWIEKTSIISMTSSEEVKSQHLCTMQLLSSLQRLQKTGILICVVVISLEVVAYPVMKYGEVSGYYNTHADQYLYMISGVYVKTTVPAVVLFVLHSIMIGLILYAFFRVFVSDWKILRFASPVHDDSKMNASTSTSPRVTWHWFGQVASISVMKSIILLALMVFAVVANVGYVYITDSLNNLQNACIQLALLVFNGCIRMVLPVLVLYLFQDRATKSHNALSVSVMAGLLSFVDIAVPVVATVFGDDLCLHQILFEKNEIDISYTSTVCYPDVYDPTICDYSEISKTIPFEPTPVYSGQCRNAVLKYFLPVVIYACAFESFMYPVMYFVFTYKLKSLNTIITVLGYSFPAKDLVLYDANYSLVLIWGDLLLLLTYGVISPLAAFAIGVNIYSKIYIFMASICLYHHLQTHPEDVDDEENICREQQEDMDHLEAICSNCKDNAHALTWPGIVISSILFSMYLFDVAYDTESPSFEIPIVIACMNLCIVPISIFIFYQSDLKIQSDLEQRLLDSYDGT